MNPLRLAAENYRSFGKLAFTFPEGLTAITGDNGAGKSSVVNAIELALFGGRLAAEVTEGEETMRLALVFEHGGETYTIERGYSAAGRGKTTLVFARDGEALTRESARATQTLIEETIGFTRETWRASAFLAQGDGAAFTEAEPRDRKAILAEAVLGRDPIWPRLLAAVRADRAAAESHVAGLQESIRRSAAELVALPDVTEQILDAETKSLAAAGQVELYETAEKNLAEQVAAAEAVAQTRAVTLDRLRILKSQLAAQDDAVLRMKQAAVELVQVDRDVEAVGRLAAEARLLREAMAEYRVAAIRRKAAQDDRDRLNAQAEQANAAILQLRGRVSALDATETCETCGQPLNSAARQTTAESLGARLAEAVAARDAALAQAFDVSVPDIGTPPGPLSVAQEEAEARFADLVSRQAGLRAIAESNGDKGFNRQDLVFAIDKATRELEVLPDAKFEPRQELAEIRVRLSNAREEREQAVSYLAALRTRKERLEGVQAQLREDEEGAAAVQRRLQDFAVLERAYSQGGIPALLIENTAIPQIEAEANRILGELGGVAVGVQLHTQRERKSGDGLSDALDIVVSTETGQRDYRTLSGGERSRVNVALRIALAGLLAGKLGAESKLLVIDEPDGLDQAGFTALLDVLAGLADTFSKILVVSHHPELRDSIEQTIRLAKVAGRSEVQE